MAFNPISCEQTRRLILSGAHFGAALATGAAALLGQPYRVLEVAAALSCISSLLTSEGEAAIRRSWRPPSVYMSHFQGVSLTPHLLHPWPSYSELQGRFLKHLHGQHPLPCLIAV